SGSGVDRILYSLDGGAQQTYAGPISLTSTTTVAYQAVDKVGNAEPMRSQQVQIDVSPPSTPLVGLTAGASTGVSRSTVFAPGGAAAPASTTPQPRLRSPLSTTSAAPARSTRSTRRTAATRRRSTARTASARSPSAPARPRSRPAPTTPSATRRASRAGRSRS